MPLSSLTRIFLSLAWPRGGRRQCGGGAAAARGLTSISSAETPAVSTTTAYLIWQISGFSFISRLQTRSLGMRVENGCAMAACRNRQR
jgi:hypothetical protein